MTTTPFDRIQAATGLQGKHNRKVCPACKGTGTVEEQVYLPCSSCKGTGTVLDTKNKYFEALWMVCPHKNAAWRDTEGMMAVCPDCHVEWDSFPLYPNESLKAPIAYIPRPRAEAIEPLETLILPIAKERHWSIAPSNTNSNGWSVWDIVINCVVAKDLTPIDALCAAVFTLPEWKV